MKNRVGLLAIFLLGGCITPSTQTGGGNPGAVDLRKGLEDGDTAKECHGRETQPPENVFVPDSGTVFFANFNDNLTDFISGDNGTATGTTFVKSLLVIGLKMNLAGAEKAAYRFPATEALSLTIGTMEALVYADGSSSSFSHIIDKSWQYGMTDYNGSLALHFGGGWWYSQVALPLGKWSYVGGSYDGKTIKLYLNGELVDSAPYTGFNGSSAYELGIGNASDNGFDIPFIGIIDEVRISRSVKSAADIARTWNSINGK